MVELTIKFQPEKTTKTQLKIVKHTKNNQPLTFEGNLCRLNIEPDSQAST